MKCRTFVRLLSVTLGLLSTAAAHLAQAASLPPQWWQMPGSPPGLDRHDDLFFINENLGWSARKDGTIHKTSDGGLTWQKKIDLPKTHFRAIGFSTPLRGWAGNLGPGLFWGDVQDNNPLYETSDGGETWTPVPGIWDAGVRGLCAIYVLDQQHIYASGRVIGPAFFLRTTDGGQDWTVRRISHVEGATLNAIMDVYFHDPMNGFLVGMDTHPHSRGCQDDYFGRIARTTDGGETWTPVVTTDITCSYFWKITFPTPQVGYASLEQNALHDDIVFYKTTNGGENWSRHTISKSLIDGDEFYFQAIGFVNENEGWIGGASGTSSPAHNFLHTSDGGLTWTPSGYDNSQQINRIRFLQADFGVAAGSKLHVYRSPLSIETQPASQQATQGSTVKWAVQVSGSPPFTFQWLKNGSPIQNATSAQLLLENITPADAGHYTVIVQNAFGEVTSQAAALEVGNGLLLHIPEITDGQRVRLVLSHAGGTPLTSEDAGRLELRASTDLVEWGVISAEMTLEEGELVFEIEIGEFPQRFFQIIERD